MKNRIEVVTDGKVLSDWKNASVAKSLTGVCGSFEVSAADRMKVSALPVRPQDSVVVRVDEDDVLTGYVDVAAFSGDATMHETHITGRDKTCDLVDCTVKWPAAKFGSTTLYNICKSICDPFSIEVVKNPSIPQTLQTIADFDITQGENALDVLQRAAKYKGVLLSTDAKGRLIFSDPGAKKANDAIVLGKNVKAFAATYDFTSRFSLYQTYGQAAGSLKSTGVSDLSEQWGATLVASVDFKDPNVRRYRPTFIQCETAISKADIKKRASYEANNAAGRSQILTVTLQGWRQTNDALWIPGLSVFVDIPAAYVKGDLVIDQVRYGITEKDGMTVQLTLMSKAAFAVFRDSLSSVGLNRLQGLWNSDG